MESSFSKEPYFCCKLCSENLKLIKTNALNNVKNVNKLNVRYYILNKKVVCLQLRTAHLEAGVVRPM